MKPVTLLSATAVALAVVHASAAEKEEEVIITGTRLNHTPGSTHVIGREELDRFHYDDVHQVLTTVPGVYVRGEDGMGLRPNIGLRGVSSDRSKKVTLMEDGILFGPAPYSAPAAYYFPMIDRMQSVRVLKGPAAIAYGPQTVGGAIDLLTREIPYERRGTADLSFGQFASRKLHLTYGAGDEHMGFLIEGMHLANNGFKDLDGGGDTGFARNEWMVKGRYSPNPDSDRPHEFQIKLGYSDEASNESYLGLSDGDFAQTPYRRYAASKYDRMEWHRTQVVVRHRVQASRDFEVTTTAYRQQFSRSWNRYKGIAGAETNTVLADPGSSENQIYYGAISGLTDSSSRGEHLLIGPNKRDFLSLGFQTQLRYTQHTGPIRHRTELGMRYHYDEIERLHTEDRFAMTNGVPVRVATEPTNISADNKASTHALAMHLVDVMTWKGLSLTPGVRFESIHSRYDDHATGKSDGAITPVVLPGVGAYLSLTPDFGLLAGVHRGFSPPPPGDSKNNRPELSVNYEAGLRYSGITKASNKLFIRAEAIAFYNDYSNITSICTASSGCLDKNIDRQFDVGAARIYGVELFGETEVPLPRGYRVPIRASYTYTDTEFLSAFSSDDPLVGKVQPGDYMPYVPEHQISGGVGIESSKAVDARGPRWALNVAGTFVDAMRERPGQGVPARFDRTDPYFLLDVSGSVHVSKRVQFYANAHNLLDSVYVVSHRPFGARPGAPRWVTAGMRVDF